MNDVLYGKIQSVTKTELFKEVVDIDYVTASGSISNYYPDFIVKLSGKRVFIIETKGFVDVNISPKMERLKQWCEDINKLQSETLFDFIYVGHPQKL